MIVPRREDINLPATALTAVTDDSSIGERRRNSIRKVLPVGS